MEGTKECIAMLLAGGEGKRLYPLTEHLAKPAVPFGGKYRIIDFTLTNCALSGIDTVGVLTQYQPMLLHEYIGSGRAWDLDVNVGGVHILPPYKAAKGGDWYSGTANAIWQNKPFIERYRPHDILVLSGDHIYRMDYGEMLHEHRKRGAAATVAAVEVEEKEASRFGIIEVDEEGTIRHFEEKPQHPKSRLASMGVYIFHTESLLHYLEKDAADATSTHDFGHDVIPAMLKGKEPLFCHRHRGYWKDVGTLESLWQANMDLVGSAPVFDLYGGNKAIRSAESAAAPQFLGKHAAVSDSLLTQGARVYGKVEHSVISADVVVAEGATVKDSVLMRGVHVGEGAMVEYAILDEGVSVPPRAVLGKSRSEGGPVTVISGEVTA